MSVLPQLERELMAAHARRRRAPRLVRLRSEAGARLLLVAGVAAAAGIVALFGLRSQPRPPVPHGAAGGQTILSGAAAGAAYVAGGQLYTQGGPAGDQLVRVWPPPRLLGPRLRDHVRFGPPLPATVDAVVHAFGRLWMAATDAVGYTHLWQLDPRTLRPLARPVLLPGSGTGDWVGSMAVAGGRLWVTNGDSLDVISAASGAVTSVRALNPSGEGLVASPDGRALFLTGATRHGFVQRLDSAGRLRKAVQLPDLYAPSIVGIVGDGIWITRFDGARVTLERLDAGGLQPTRGAVRITALKGQLGAALTGGVLWVSDGPRSYCADPGTGRARAYLSSARWLVLGGAGEGHVYYALNVTGRHPSLVRAPIDPRCR